MNRPEGEPFPEEDQVDKEVGPQVENVDHALRIPYVSNPFAGKKIGPGVEFTWRSRESIEKEIHSQEE